MFRSNVYNPALTLEFQTEEERLSSKFSFYKKKRPPAEELKMAPEERWKQAGEIVGIEVSSRDGKLRTNFVENEAANIISVSPKVRDPINQAIISGQLQTCSYEDLQEVSRLNREGPVVEGVYKGGNDFFCYFDGNSWYVGGGTVKAALVNYQTGLYSAEQNRAGRGPYTLHQAMSKGEPYEAEPEEPLIEDRVKDGNPTVEGLYKGNYHYSYWDGTVWYTNSMKPKLAMEHYHERHIPSFKSKREGYVLHEAMRKGVSLTA